jgi:hypothetical protein
MAQRDGVTTSIVDVSGLNGQTLVFSWNDLSTSGYDTLAPYTDTQHPPVARLVFYVAAGCHAPAWSAFVLTTDPGHRSASFTIPSGATWLLVESLDISGHGSWSAS